MLFKFIRKRISEKSQSFMKKEKLYNCNNYDPIKIVVKKAEGAYLWDVDGKSYLDCISAYSALN